MLIRRMPLVGAAMTAVTPPVAPRTQFNYCSVIALSVNVDIQVFSKDDPLGANGNFIAVAGGFERTFPPPPQLAGGTAPGQWGLNNFEQGQIAFYLLAPSNTNVALIWG